MNNITLITDFGLRDGYVAMVKGVIKTINPDAVIFDITHLIPRHDINSAMFVIFAAYKYFPEGTVHVVIVDPGVGSERKIICVETAKYVFLAPDNGVLSWIIQEEKECKIIHITDPDTFLPNVSSSFHGRDIFAPVAGKLSSGDSPISMGVKFENPKIDPFPEISLIDNKFFEVTILYVDIYGNIITNLENKYYDQVEEIYMSSGELLPIKPASYYSDAQPGKAVFFQGSSGYIEIAVNLDSASEKFSLSNREIILFRRKV